MHETPSPLSPAALHQRKPVIVHHWLPNWHWCRGLVHVHCVALLVLLATAAGLAIVAINPGCCCVGPTGRGRWSCQLLQAVNGGKVTCVCSSAFCNV